MRAVWTIPFLLSMAAAVHAGEGRVQVSVMVPVLQRLETQPAVFSLPQITPLDLAAGFVDVREPVRLTVFSNSPWELSVRRAVQGADASRKDPLTVQWNLGEGGYHDLSDEWTLVASGPGPAAGEALSLRLRLSLAWSSGGPGVYEPRIEYRLAPVGG